MPASFTTFQGEKTGKLLDGRPMTPVAASNGTLNPAATGGTHATKRRRSILHRAAYCSGLGSTDRQPACPFATILRLDLSRLLGFVDISPLHPLAHVGNEALDPSQSLPPHEATGVMLMSDTCVHRPSSRWIVAPCPISAGYRVGYLLNNTSSEQLLAKEKYMLRRQQHSDFGAFSSDFRSRQHGRSSSWSPQYPVLTKKPEPECKAGLDLTYFRKYNFPCPPAHIVVDCVSCQGGDGEGNSGHDSQCPASQGLCQGRDTGRKRNLVFFNVGGAIW